MTLATFSKATHERFFEDYELGGVYEFGSVTISEAEIIDFATRFDPQPFHINPKRAKQTIYGGIIASGWHTCSIMMRLLADNFISSTAGMGSPGVDRLRWPIPVRGGDELSIRVTILEMRQSKSKPDRGIMKNLTELLNQNGEVVMEMQGVSFIACRETTN
ncbi:MAG TPA: acyl dehydratase [Gammaproteobacteria bacterium]|nr:acyl dehydratase [Gammaproteobacteria bacterium]|tara:strand:- start:424 stop:906 length:483 start_codon:yes stop_codon:yes gene_type:complete